MSNTTIDIQKRLSEMTESEKEALFEGIEFMLDNGEGKNIPADDIALFNAIIEERRQKNSSQPSLNEQIQSAEARQFNQDALNQGNAPEQSR